MKEKVHKHIREQRLLCPGERVAVAVSGGADSVALLRVLLELREELGIVLSAAHFHHQIRGAEADADRDFVRALAERFQLEFHAGSQDVPAFARERQISLESAARELRHQWFAGLIQNTGLIQNSGVDKVATAHTLDDQAETVLMRVLRGTGVRGLAGISPEHKDKRLIRPLLGTTRKEVEAYLTALGQPWRNDSSNLDLSHTRNRVRHTLLPLLEREFNPAVRQTLADLAEVARGEDEYWRKQLAELLPRLVRAGKPARGGRSASGSASDTLAIDLTALRGLPMALQRMVLQHTAEQLGVAVEFKHIQQLMELLGRSRASQGLSLPGGLRAECGWRELRFSRETEEIPAEYEYLLPVPGQVRVPELGKILRAVVITAGKQTISSYNAASLLNRSLLAPELRVRNWRAGDRFFPAHSQSPKKVKELLQPSRIGAQFSSHQRKLWPVIESAGAIVWMRGYPVPQAFAVQSGEAVLIEELRDDS